MKAREFDKEIKNQVKMEEQKPLIDQNWDMGLTWEKINKLLAKKNTKVIVWYCSLAASITMVMANTLHLFPTWEGSQAPEKSISETAAIKLDVMPEIQTSIDLDDHIQTVIPKGITTPSIMELPKIEELAFESQYNNTQSEAQTEKAVYSITVNPKLNLNFNTNSVGFGGTVAVMKKVGDHKKLVNQVGLSLEYRSQSIGPSSNEFGNKLQSQALYINTVIGKEDDWTINVGYNLLKNDTSEQGFNPALKVNYLHRVARGFSVGPEVIIDSNFKKVFPAITLSFG